MTCVALAALLLSASESPEATEPAPAPPPAFDLSLVKETGETSRCVNPTKIVGLAIPADGVMLFQVGDKLFVNKPLNECRARTGPLVFTIRKEGALLCKNDQVYPAKRMSSRSAKKCVLGEFREAVFVAPVSTDQ